MPDWRDKIELDEIEAKPIPSFPSKTLAEQAEEFQPQDIPEQGELAKIEISIFEIVGYTAQKVYIYSKAGLSIVVLAIKLATFLNNSKEKNMDTKGILQSKTFWSSALGITALILGGVFGITVDGATQSVIVDSLVAGIAAVTTLVSLIGAIFGRKAATTTIK